jgi:hypothetical protein
MESMAGMKWNQWPGSNGMGGRNGVESLAGIIWNTHKTMPAVNNAIIAAYRANPVNPVILSKLDIQPAST